MEIKTKFNVGDVVYVCKRNKTHESENCNICDGKGIVTIKGNDFTCPRCNGNKHIHIRGVNSFVPEERTIKKIKIFVHFSKNKGGTQIYTKYEFGSHDGYGRYSVADYNNMIFTTKEEAEARCKELNAEKSQDGSR